MSGDGSAQRPALGLVSGNAPPLPGKPSIAVLPFDNLSGDKEQEYFADGITEDIITGLSTMRWLFVIARNSSFTYKGQAVDVKQVGKDLGMRYVLEGSVRKAGQRVRVTAQLIEADSGSHVWADRFDGTIEDIFELQDELTAKIVGALGPEMTMAEIDLRRNKTPANFDAWDFYLRALPHFYAITELNFENAVALLQQSIAMDPNFSNAYALLGYCHSHAALHGWSGRRRDNVETALQYAQKAVALDPLNPLGYAALAEIYHVRGPMDEAIAAAERALELEPNNAKYWRHLSSALGFAGRPDEALAAAENAERGSPRDPEHFHVVLARASACFVAGRLDDALRAAKQAACLQPNFYACHAFTAASAGLLGKEDEAKAAAQSLLKLVPRFSFAAMRRNPMFERAADLERMIEGFRLAGLPEE
jgi:TolB-like protein/Flp pilus assembly protein TadD